MRKFLLIAVVFFSVTAARAEQFESPMLNMTVPSGLDDGQAYLTLDGRFSQSLNGYPKGDLFALLDNGVNFGINFRYMAEFGIEAKAGYITNNREQFAGLSYAFYAQKFFFNSQLDVQFFSYKNQTQPEYAQNLFYLLSLQSVPFYEDRITASVDLGYDGYNSHIGLGLGLSYEIINHFRLLAEYYPLLKDSGTSPDMGNTGCYSFGVKFDTFGHQFILKAGNSVDVGTRRMLLGVKTQDAYIGLTVMRLIAF